MLWCVVRALMADAWATPLERVEFEGATQRLNSGGLIRGDRIQGYLAKPQGAGPFPAVVGLHGCAGMHDTTKQKLAGKAGNVGRESCCQLPGNLWRYRGLGPRRVRRFRKQDRSGPELRGGAVGRASWGTATERWSRLVRKRPHRVSTMGGGP